MEEATNLFNQRLPGHDPSLVKKLAGQLGFIPRAIKQAAATIGFGGFSIEEYIRKFEKCQAEAIDLLCLEYQDSFRTNTPKAVIEALTVTFDTIHEKAPWAIDTLAFLAFVDGQNIPLALLASHNQLRQRQRLENIGVRQNDFVHASHSLDDGLEQLEACDLISPGSENNYIMTEAIQLSMKSWLKKNCRDHIYADHCVQVLVMSWPAKDDPGTEIKDQLLSHIAVVADDELVKRNKTTPWDILLRHAGGYALGKGRYLLASGMLEKSTLACKEMLDLEDPAILDELLIYFRALRLSEQNEAAQTVGEDLKDRMERMLGPIHPATLRCIRVLGTLYVNQDKLDKSEEILSKAYTNASEKFEKDDDNLLSISHFLAMTYFFQKKYKEALARHFEVYDAFKAKYGAEHAQTFPSRCNIGRTYCALGQWSKALEWLGDLVKAMSQLFGESHPETANAKIILARVYLEFKRFDEAERTCEEVIEVYTKAKGETHSDTISSMIILCLIYMDTGRNKECGELNRQLAEMTENAPNVTWPSKISIMQIYAWSLGQQRNLEQAIAILKQALKTSKDNLGDGLTTASVLHNLAECYAVQENFKEAAPLAVNSYEICRAKMGVEHKTTLVQWFRARSFETKNGTLVAPEEYQSMLHAYISIYGDNDTATFKVMYCLAWAYWHKDMRPTAVGWMEKCAEGQRQIQVQEVEFKAEEALLDMRSYLDNPSSDSGSDD